MTNELILFVVSVLPVFLIGMFVYKKDRQKEPTKLLIKLFLGGIGSCFLVLIVSLFLDLIFPIFSADETDLNLVELFIQVFIGVALVEEFCKWIIAYKISYNDKDFDEFYDSILYCVFVALGFASVENIIAILGNGFDISFAIKRSLITVPAHSFFAISSGYYLGKAKRYNKRNWFKKSKKYIIFSLLLPIFIHGMFDYLLFVSTNISLILETLLIVYLYITSYIKIKKTYKKDKIK